MLSEGCPGIIIIVIIICVGRRLTLSYRWARAAIPSGEEKTEMWLEQRVWLQTLGDQGLPGWRKMGCAYCSVDGGKEGHSKGKTEG